MPEEEWDKIMEDISNGKRVDLRKWEENDR